MLLLGLSRKGKIEREMCLQHFQGGEGWQIMLLEIIKIDLNRIAMTSDVRATLFLFPSLSSPVLHMEEHSVWLWFVLTSSFLLAGQELQLLYVHCLNSNMQHM